MPFAVRTSDEHEYAVPTADHASMNPTRTLLIIYTDYDEEFSLSARHIASVTRRA